MISAMSFPAVEGGTLSLFLIPYLAFSILKVRSIISFHFISLTLIIALHPSTMTSSMVTTLDSRPGVSRLEVPSFRCECQKLIWAAGLIQKSNYKGLPSVSISTDFLYPLKRSFVQQPPTSPQSSIQSPSPQPLFQHPNPQLLNYKKTILWCNSHV